MFSRFDQQQLIDPRTLIKPGAHVIVFGRTGSGKTTVLLWLAGEYYQIDETVVWRDSNTLESFSLLGVVPMKVHVPAGCKFNLEHEHLEHHSFDPKDLPALFEAFDKDKVNVIVFDYFCFEDEVRLIFWSNFFHELWDWKSRSRKRIRRPLTLIVDEFSFLCPGDRMSQIAGQRKLSNNIYQSMTSFRKWNIRLVASGHNPNDVHYGTRQQFSFKIYKKTSRQAVPSDWWMYAHHFPKLKVYEAIVFDEDDDFNKIRRTPLFVEPRKFVVPRIGEVRREQVVDEEDTPRKSAQKWRKRAVDAAQLLMGHEILESFKAVADLWKIDPSYAWKLLKSSGEEDEAPPEEGREEAPSQEEEEVSPASRFSE